MHVITKFTSLSTKFMHVITKFSCMTIKFFYVKTSCFDRLMVRLRNTTN